MSKAMKSKVPLREICDVIHGYAFPGSDFSDDLFQPTLVTPGNFSMGGGFQETKPKTFSGSFPEQYLLPAGALIVTMTDLSKNGDTLGYSAKVPEGRIYLHNQRVGRVVVTNPEVANLDYIGWVMRGSAYRQHILGSATGSTVRHTSPTRILDFEIALPRLEEQKRIAGVLSSLDDLIVTNKVQMAYLDQLALSYFLSKWDGETYSRIDTIGEVLMGQSPAGENLNEENNGIVFYQGVRDFGDRYPTPRVFCSAPSRLASKGDILIAVRAPVGDTNVATEETAIGRGVAALKAKFPATALRSLRASGSIWSPYQDSGTVFSSITGPDLRGAKVPYVADESLESFLKSLDELHYGLFMENINLSRTRDELLPLLLSGAIKVKEVAG